MVETDPTSVYLSVCDTGRGIPAESLPQVFERLYQDPQAVDGNRSGLGLGLYIAKEIVALHGGRMWVASEAGNGSTFSFTLPLYSLAKLLLPVITHNGHLREGIVLVRVELTPLSKSLRGSWKETCQQCLELLRLCIYVDKDLVLPPIGTGGADGNVFRGRLDRHGAGRHHGGPHTRPGRRAAQVKGQRHAAGDGRDDSRAARGRLEDAGTTSLGRCRLRQRNYPAESLRTNNNFNEKEKHKHAHARTKSRGSP